MIWNLSHTEITFVLGIVFVLWLIGIYFIYKRTTSLSFIRRSLFLAIGLMGVALILIQPHSTLKLDREEIHIWTSEPSSEAMSDTENNFRNVHDFLQSDLSDKASQVHIHGMGLEEASLHLLSDYVTTYHPSPLINGITQIDVPTITEGRPYTLTGHYQGAEVKTIALIESDKSQNEASLQDSSFSINSTAPTAGSYLLDIETILNNGDTLRDKLPIEVAHEPTWQMLILSSYPVFENKYLKNYWTSLGNGFTLRSKVSKSKYNSTYVNAPQRNLETISRKVVSAFDYIITDVPTWNQLSSGEQGNIKSAVRNNGLGLVFRPSSRQVIADDITLPKWEEPSEILWKTTTDDVRLLSYNAPSSWESIKIKSHTVGKVRSWGLGHVAILTLDETYKLILADKENEYKRIWSALFSELYRDFAHSTKLLHETWIWEGQKTRLAFISQNPFSDPPRLNDAMDIPVLKVPLLEGISELTLYPSEGYNTLTVQNNEAINFYAHSRDTWKAMKQKQLREAYSKSGRKSMVQEATYDSSEPIPIFWWYLLFLVGFGALWLVERIWD